MVQREVLEARTVYSVAGRFTSSRPAHVDTTLDLAGAWVVPPFGEAHNHNVDGALESRSRDALARYLADGVFYVKIQGNFPVSEDMRHRLPMNRPDGPDVVFAQASSPPVAGTRSSSTKPCCCRRATIPASPASACGTASMSRSTLRATWSASGRISAR
jgi:hypothetical protein